MWQRPQVFVVMAGCLLSSIVPVWGQSRLPDGNRQDTVEAFSSERHKPRREEWWSVADVGSEEAPIEGLASVRRSNGTCSFPAFRFHEWPHEI